MGYLRNGDGRWSLGRVARVAGVAALVSVPVLVGGVRLADRNSNPAYAGETKTAAQCESCGGNCGESCPMHSKAAKAVKAADTGSCPSHAAKAAKASAAAHPGGCPMSGMAASATKASAHGGCPMSGAKATKASAHSGCPMSGASATKAKAGKGMPATMHAMACGGGCGAHAPAKGTATQAATRVAQTASGKKAAQR